ncbi:transposase [Solirhodobacter olei]|uniref:transposase n=1 Tax=Solirhodobacter olei TaxID=2493082 RepID=UPI0013E2C50F|nr:transposase [Solirhodobacter olei]
MHAEAIAIHYCRNRFSAYDASLSRRGWLWIWFDPNREWRPAKADKRGHPQAFSECAVQFCLTMTVQFDLPLRQLMDVVASLLEMAGPDRARLLAPLSSGGED